jgi:molybdate transport system substrate-binding protein
MRFLARFVAGSLVVALSLVALAAASAAPRAATTINVTLTDRAIKLSKKTAAAGDVVRFAVRNTGKARHNFSIAGRKTANLKTNQTASLAVTFSKAGNVRYSSTVRGDAARGLTGTFVLKAAAPIPTYPPINVLAAASLTDVFPAIDRDEKYSFAGSNALATQIRNGAPADVFASANTDIPAQLYQQGLVDRPVNFTRNALVIVVPKSNPAKIGSVYDLGNPGTKIVVAAPSVPVGAYTTQVLRQMNLTSKVTPNVVSQETDVRSVLSKVALGQADAGFVYATDAQTVPNDVTVIKVPVWAQPKVVYAMAVVSRSSNKAAAQAFIDRIMSPAGQAALEKYGFLALPSTGGTSGY